MEETSIEEAAEAAVYLERGEAFVGKGSVRLGGSFGHRPAGAYFAGQVRAPGVREFHLRDVVLDAAHMLLFKNGRVIRETRYLLGDEAYRRAKVTQARVRNVDGPETVVVGCNLGRHNYYHWLIQAVPAIDGALRGRDRAVRLALPSLSPWQSDMLTLLGHDGVQRLSLDRECQYLLPHAAYCEFLNGSLAFALSRTALTTFRRLREAVPPSYSPHRWIYVARTNSRHRVAINEAALIEHLRQEGVHIVVPGRSGSQSRSPCSAAPAW